MEEPRQIPTPDRSDKSVGEMVFDVSERTSTLVREEIELAKAEITEKVNQLVRGSVVGLVGAVFLFFALLLFMHGFAWLLNDLVFDNFWAGFFVEAALFLLIGAIAVLIASRAFKKGAPPTPDLAIEEAKRTRARLEKPPGEGPQKRAPEGLEIPPDKQDTGVGP
jgi:uncharacterized membrane protein YqjE